MPKVRLHYGQGQILMAPHRTVIGVAGVQSGKSYVGPLWLAREIQKNPGGNWLVTSSDYPRLSLSTMPTLMQHWAGTEYDGEWLESKHLFKFKNPNLGQIITLSADNWKGIQGFNVGACWADEAGQYDERAWRAILTRCAKNDARVLLTSTPYDIAGWFVDLVNSAKPTDPNYDSKVFAYNWPSNWNPTFSQERFEYERAHTAPAWFRLMYLGDVNGVPEHAVCPEFNKGDHVRACTYDPALPIWVSCDFNNSPLCWSISQPHGETLHVLGEIIIPDHATTRRALDILWERCSTHKAGFCFYGDRNSRDKHPNADTTDYIQINNDPRFIAAGRQINIPLSNPNIINSVAALNNKLHCKEIFIDPKCTHLIEDMLRAEFKPGTRDIDKKKHDPHSLDNLRYLVFTVWPLKVVQAAGPSIMSMPGKGRY